MLKTLRSAMLLCLLALTPEAYAQEDAAPTEPPSLDAVPEAQRAVDKYERGVEFEQARFDAALQQAMQQYTAGVQKHRVQLTRELTTVQSSRTRAGNLDAALAVRDFIRYLSTLTPPTPDVPRALVRSGGDPITSDDPSGDAASEPGDTGGEEGEPSIDDGTTDTRNRILADELWQTVGTFRAGQSVTITFAGQWSGGSYDHFSTGPGGNPDLPAPDSYPLPAAPSFSVVGRFEGGQRVFPIGETITFTAPTDCTLQAMINDTPNGLTDNSGQLSYTLETAEE